MKPVIQTSFYDPDAPPKLQRGNCFTAVVASFLELPIDEVPNFVQDHVDNMDEFEEAGEWNWWTRFTKFIKERGWEVQYLFPVETPDFKGDKENWFRLPEEGEFYAVSGISPRDPNIHHIVIYQDGKMVHDPHPDSTGLALVDDTYHLTLRKVDNG